MAAALQTNELVQNVAETRYNIYTIIHKGLRAFMSDTLLKTGRMDVNDDAERAQTVEQVRALLAMSASHLRHEDEFLHSALERARPGSAARTAEEHHGHEAAIAALEVELARLEAASLQRRDVLARQLYLHLSAFVAENFEHMIVEERDNHAMLIEAYSDEEVLSIEHAIVASLSPEESFAGLRWMIPFINSDERAFLLGGMKRNAPPEAFQAVLGLARDMLTQRDYYKLERALA